MIHRILLIFLTLLIFGIAETSAGESKTVNQNLPADYILKEMIPEKQLSVMAELSQFAQKYQTSRNAVQKYLLREKRREYLAKELQSKELTEWLGKITTLRTTNKGKAYLEIQPATLSSNRNGAKDNGSSQKVSFGTWNNAYTDLDYETLILPGTEFHNFLVNFEEGEWVLFSGTGFSGDEDFLKESSPTEKEAMLSPRFILKFDFLEKVEFPEPESEPIPESVVAESNSSKTIPESVVAKNNFTQTSSAKKTEVKTSSQPGSSISQKKQKPKGRTFGPPTVHLRYYQNYRLSRYDWDYQPYVSRWEKLIRYHWRNHPPEDYLQGKTPGGGEVYVLAVVERDGRISKYQTNVRGAVSEQMKIAALDAVKVVPVPPLPDDFPYPILKAEFRFNHPLLQKWQVEEEKPKKEKISFSASKQSSRKKGISKIKERKQKQEAFSRAVQDYLESIKPELVAHFDGHQNFSPDLSLEVELEIKASGKISKRTITQKSDSDYFQLMVMNGLRQAKLQRLPKLLKEEGSFRARVKVTP